MKVFVSWSGPRSQLLANALRDWLKLVLHYVEPWLSDADLAAGERWGQALAKELETSNFGVICVTRERISHRRGSCSKLARSRSRSMGAA